MPQAQIIQFDEQDAIRSLQQRLFDSRIPTYMHEWMINWILFGTTPGSFLDAVLSNDLMQACERADDTNHHLLFEYASFLHNYAPRGCCGSQIRRNEWQLLGGLRGIYHRTKENEATTVAATEQTQPDPEDI